MNICNQVLMQGTANFANVILAPPKPVLISRPVLPKIVASYLSSTIKICGNLFFLLLCKYLHSILSLGSQPSKSKLLTVWSLAEKFADPAVEVSLLVRGVGPWLQGWQSEAMPDALLEAVGSQIRIETPAAARLLPPNLHSFSNSHLQYFSVYPDSPHTPPQKSKKPKWIKLLKETAWNRIQLEFPGSRTLL